jgi:hypothetical protein
MERAPLLAIHTAARPVDHHEPISHNEVATRAKLSAEGALKEQKIILGWYFDLQQLTITLPENKLIAWTESINSMLLIGKTTPKELKQLIGRLSHPGMVVPFCTPLPELPTRPTSLLKELERGRFTGQMQEGSGINVTFSGNWGERS